MLWEDFGDQYSNARASTWGVCGGSARDDGFAVESRAQLQAYYVEQHGARSSALLKSRRLLGARAAVSYIVSYNLISYSFI